MCIGLYGVVGTNACGTHSFVRFRREKKINDGLFFSLWARTSEGKQKKKKESRIGEEGKT